ncbi:MAG: hypothetical protein PF636_08780 [Actinomycetota bacterium]|jgi:hypothetical protein|nr:hypothetical protein [Actinomycetota bacterium]
MDDQSLGRRPDVHRLLVLLASFVAAPLLLIVWTTIGFFILMPLDAVGSGSADGQAPSWLVYSGLAFLVFAWPLLLLRLTRRIRTLNRVLMVLLLIAGIAFLLGGDLVIFERALDSLPQRLAAALLLAGAVAIHGWSNRRIEQTRALGS